METLLTALQAYRLANRFIAAHRDGCVCPLCGSGASESDHVFGRGTNLNTLKEHWMLRMSLCKSCHHQKHHGAGFDGLEQVRVLKNLNRDFRRSEEYVSVLLAIKDDLIDAAIDQEQLALNFIEDWLVKNGPE